MGYFGLGSSGSQRLTADGVVGPSGKPIRVLNSTLHSAAAAGKIAFYDGTSTAGDLMVWQLGAAASSSSTQNFEGGLRFPNGCYADLNASVSAAVIEFALEA